MSYGAYLKAQITVGCVFFVIFFAINVGADYLLHQQPIAWGKTLITSAVATLFYVLIMAYLKKRKEK